MGHKSPAKIFRAVRRMTKFLESKKPILTTNVLPGINIPPILPKLSITNVQTTNIPSQKRHLPNLQFSKPVLTSYLPVKDVQPVPSKPSYHPYILEACRLMYGGKHPEQLTMDEKEHFRRFQQWKTDNGEPIEEDFVYKPSA